MLLGTDTEPDWVRGGGYVRVTNSVLYYHYQSGCYYESPKEASKAYLLQHGDYLKIGGSSFLLHIHHGMASCGECSSMGISVVGAADGGGASNNESLEMQRRKGLNKLKKKYGLRLKDSFGDESYKLPENYTDNAPARRKRYGVELPQSAIRDDSPSTVNDPFSSSNKGHQMLKKFGWREGDSLGAADNKGITEPERI
ncbi:PREDICTED: angiogenic factor with G patch and FHA domains 1-like isoform X1 [Amphimedon queenslandica]|uniref:G-patch domain-containing protein n=1 Tax=Amphimedon queenslandica TaxID=400682 RepID=A0AAN0J8J2_AMPQE|nr:PREDICTED: angiogenic factor with G patch and FHA domains 1-like isoform X1 [Amphimedon queenslandica]|eukprot:XP_019853329.1 PREDICTED: angiogenic factor with G patch and FHA domains 1-like isoform X1 [Amphimedon queenslandica]